MPERPIPERLKKRWVTGTEACRVLAMSRTTLWRKRQSGELEGEEFNGQVIISRASVDQYLRRYERGIV